MSVDVPRVVDAIGVEKQTGKVVLTISDHLDWENEGDHLQVLEDKINAYVSFIEGGEIMESYPDAEGRQPVIDVIHKFACPAAAERFYTEATAVLLAAGIELRHRQLK